MHSPGAFKVTLLFLCIFLFLLLLHRPHLDPRCRNTPWPLNSHSIGRTPSLNSHSIGRTPSLHTAKSCICRTQQDMLRIPSMIHNLPQEFSKAVTQYEKMHSRCYALIDLKHPGLTTNSCKYLVFGGIEGLGNRLTALVAVFVYALLTDRVFLLDYRDQVSKLLCEPFSNSSWVLPHDFSHKFLDKSSSFGEYEHLNKPGQILHVHLSSLRRDQQFFYTETRKQLGTVQWMMLHSNLYFVPRLFLLPEFWKPLMKIFPEPNMAFTHLTRIVRFHRTYLFGKGVRRIGLQIRLHHRSNPGMFHTPTYQRIMQCLVGRGLLPLVVNATKDSEQEQNNNSKRIVVYVASLQERYYRDIKEVYMKYPTVDGSVVQVHMYSHEGQENREIEQAENALIEMWLLGLSDVLVTSSSSTFGYVAQGVAGVRPYVLHIKTEDFRDCKYPACSLRVSPAPCNHVAYLEEHEELERTPKHNEWVRTRTGRCQDNYYALQLL